VLIQTRLPAGQARTPRTRKRQHPRWSWRCLRGSPASSPGRLPCADTRCGARISPPSFRSPTRCRTRLPAREAELGDGAEGCGRDRPPAHDAGHRAEAAGQFRELLGAEENQDHDQNPHDFRPAEHREKYRVHLKDKLAAIDRLVKGRKGPVAYRWGRRRMNSARRFWAQAASSCPKSFGLSSP
jgi:hypothetical protein